MAKENHVPQAKANKKLVSSVGLKTSCHEVLENELWGSLSKLEHRMEILMAISHNRREAGYYELAEAYKQQAAELKVHAQSIRKLLMDLA